jgi:hypothetical protein
VGGILHAKHVHISSTINSEACVPGIMMLPLQAPLKPLATQSTDRNNLVLIETAKSKPVHVDHNTSQQSISMCVLPCTSRSHCQHADMKHHQQDSGKANHWPSVSNH